MSSSTTVTNQKTRLSLGCVLPLLVLAAFGCFWVLAAVFGWFRPSHPIPNYANARAAELTAKGNQFVDSFYKNNKRENSLVKVLLTTDPTTNVVSFYETEFSRLGYQSFLNHFQAVPNALATDFETKTAAYVVVINDQDDGLITGGLKPGETYIIIAEGSPGPTPNSYT